jgi:hypothetical protein
MRKYRRSKLEALRNHKYRVTNDSSPTASESVLGDSVSSFLDEKNFDYTIRVVSNYASAEDEEPQTSFA